MREIEIDRDEERKRFSQDENEATNNGLCECVCAVLCMMQTVKEYANNNGSKNGEINTTSIILNDFATTRMGFQHS